MVISLPSRTTRIADLHRAADVQDHRAGHHDHRRPARVDGVGDQDVARVEVLVGVTHDARPRSDDARGDAVVL